MSHETPNHPVTSAATVPAEWEMMIRVEPALAALALEISRLALSRRQSWKTYSSYKRRLEPLVGWMSENRSIGSSDHWDASLPHTLDLLGEGVSE
jgi:hypothetical protein